MITECFPVPNKTKPQKNNKREKNHKPKKPNKPKFKGVSLSINKSQACTESEQENKDSNYVLITHF